LNYGIFEVMFVMVLVFISNHIWRTTFRRWTLSPDCDGGWRQLLITCLIKCRLSHY
jgi:hypothetical protein